MKIINYIFENYKLKIYASTVKSKNNFKEQDLSVRFGKKSLIFKN